MQPCPALFIPATLKGSLRLADESKVRWRQVILGEQKCRTVLLPLRWSIWQVEINESRKEQRTTVFPKAPTLWGYQTDEEWRFISATREGISDSGRQSCGNSRGISTREGSAEVSIPCASYDPADVDLPHQPSAD